MVTEFHRPVKDPTKRSTMPSRVTKMHNRPTGRHWKAYAPKAPSWELSPVSSRVGLQSTSGSMPASAAVLEMLQSWTNLSARRSPAAFLETRRRRGRMSLLTAASSSRSRSANWRAEALFRDERGRYRQRSGHEVFRTYGAALLILAESMRLAACQRWRLHGVASRSSRGGPHGRPTAAQVKILKVDTYVRRISIGLESSATRAVDLCGGQVSVGPTIVGRHQ